MLAANIVKVNMRDLEAMSHRVIRALPQAGALAAKVTDIVDATDLGTTAAYDGCGQVTRTRRSTDKRGKVHEIAVTVYGWKLIVFAQGCYGIFHMAEYSIL